MLERRRARAPATRATRCAPSSTSAPSGGTRTGPAARGASRPAQQPLRRWPLRSPAPGPPARRGAASLRSAASLRPWPRSMTAPSWRAIRCRPSIRAIASSTDVAPTSTAMGSVSPCSYIARRRAARRPLRGSQRAARQTEGLLGLGPVRADLLRSRAKANERGSCLLQAGGERDRAQPGGVGLPGEGGVFGAQLLCALSERRCTGAARCGQLQSDENGHRRGYEPSPKAGTWLSHGRHRNNSRSDPRWLSLGFAVVRRGC